MRTAPSNGNELQRHYVGVAPSRDAGSEPDTMPSVLGHTRDAPLLAVLIAGSIGYGLGWLTALSRPHRAEPLPDYARKRA